MSTNLDRVGNPALTRKVSFLLGVGILIIPLIFSWFLLRRGYSSLSRILAFGWLIFVLIVWLAAPPPDPAAQSQREASSRRESAAQTETSSAVQPGNDASEASPAAEPSNWQYSSRTDQMRGTTTRWATIESANEVDLDFPYGVQRAKLEVRQRPEDGLQIMLSVASGQILCHGFRDSYISAKFDNGQVRRFSCNRSSDGSPEYAFIENQRQFLNSLRSARKVVIEAEFYRRGNQQFTFETAGLQWR
jgi:hypothetical protein